MLFVSVMIAYGKTAKNRRDTGIGVDGGAFHGVQFSTRMANFREKNCADASTGFRERRMGGSGVVASFVVFSVAAHDVKRVLRLKVLLPYARGWQG